MGYNLPSETQAWDSVKNQKPENLNFKAKKKNPYLRPYFFLACYRKQTYFFFRPKQAGVENHLYEINHNNSVHVSRGFQRNKVLIIYQNITYYKYKCRVGAYKQFCAENTT